VKPNIDEGKISVGTFDKMGNLSLQTPKAAIIEKIVEEKFFDLGGTK